MACVSDLRSECRENDDGGDQELEEEGDGQSVEKDGGFRSRGSRSLERGPCEHVTDERIDCPLGQLHDNQITRLNSVSARNLCACSVEWRNFQARVSAWLRSEKRTQRRKLMLI